MRRQRGEQQQQEVQRNLTPYDVMRLQNCKSFKFRKGEMYPSIRPPISQCNPAQTVALLSDTMEANGCGPIDPTLLDQSRESPYADSAAKNEKKLENLHVEFPCRDEKRKLQELVLSDPEMAEKWSKLTPNELIRMQNAYPSIRPTLYRCSVAKTAEALVDALEDNCCGRPFDMEQDDIMEVWKQSPHKNTLSFYGIGTGIPQPEAIVFNKVISQCLEKVNAPQPLKEEIPRPKKSKFPKESRICGNLVLNRPLLAVKISKMPTVQQKLNAKEALKYIHCPRPAIKSEPFIDNSPKANVEKAAKKVKSVRKKYHYCDLQCGIPENKCTALEWMTFKGDPQPYEEAFKREVAEMEQEIEAEPKNYDELYKELMTCFEADTKADPLCEIYKRCCTKSTPEDEEEEGGAGGAGATGGTGGQKKPKPGDKDKTDKADKDKSEKDKDKPEKDKDKSEKDKDKDADKDKDTDKQKDKDKAKEDKDKNKSKPDDDKSFMSEDEKTGKDKTGKDQTGKDKTGKDKTGTDKDKPGKDADKPDKSKPGKQKPSKDQDGKDVDKANESEGKNKDKSKVKDKDKGKQGGSESDIATDKKNKLPYYDSDEDKKLKPPTDAIQPPSEAGVSTADKSDQSEDPKSESEKPVDGLKKPPKPPKKTGQDKPGNKSDKPSFHKKPPHHHKPPHGQDADKSDKPAEREPPPKDCPCAICEFMKRRDLEPDTPLIREMKLKEKRRKLRDYYKQMCHRQNEKCAAPELRAPLHKCDPIECDDTFCNNPKLAEYSDCLNAMHELQKLLGPQHRIVDNELVFNLEDLRRRVCRRFCECL